MGTIEMWDMWDTYLTWVYTPRIWTEKFSLHIHIAALQFASDWNVIWHSDFISFRHDHLVILLPYWEGGLAVGIRGLQYKLNNRQMGEEYKSCGVSYCSSIPLFLIQIYSQQLPWGASKTQRFKIWTWVWSYWLLIEQLSFRENSKNSGLLESTWPQDPWWYQ